MAIHTRRIQIFPIGYDNKSKTYTNLEKNDISSKYKEISKISKELVLMSNEVTRMWATDVIKMEEDIKAMEESKGSKLTKEEKTDYIKSVLGTTKKGNTANHGSNIYTKITDKYTNIPSESRICCINTLVSSMVKTKYDMLNNKISIRSYAKELPIPFAMKKKDKIYIVNENNEYYINLPIIGIFKLIFGRDRSNNKSIVNNILGGKYKISQSKIFIKDKKIFIDLTYDQPVSGVILDPNKVLGIDLGIKRPVTLASKGIYIDQINIGGKIQHTRLSLKRQREAIQKSLRYNTGGHGRDKKMSKINDLREYESNFIKSINDQISREVINRCLKHGIGTIKMENLSGITKEKDVYFLKSWAYYQLQQQIEYKAIYEGIKVLYVVAAYTSQTCPCCKNKDSRQRKGDDFKCMNIKCKDYNVVVNADYVGAINIAERNGFEDKNVIGKKPDENGHIYDKKGCLVEDISKYYKIITELDSENVLDLNLVI